MTYLYKCENEKCKNFDVVVEIQKLMKDSDRHEACQLCTQDMVRVYTAPGIKTFGDGYKS
jgi:predicted nucleic acid-binding Zn ribbon protein